MITETWLEIDSLKVRVRKVKDQSGLRNVIEHTYYKKDIKEKEHDKFTEKNDLQL